MRTYLAWESTAVRETLVRPRGGEGRGHIVSPRAQLVIKCSDSSVGCVQVSGLAVEVLVAYCDSVELCRLCDQ